MRRWESLYWCQNVNTDLAVHLPGEVLAPVRVIPKDEIMGKAYSVVLFEKFCLPVILLLYTLVVPSLLFVVYSFPSIA